MRRLRLLLVPAGAALGIIAEQELYAWSSPAEWLPDLAAGWALIGCGLVAWSAHEASRAGKLMAVTGFLWFAGNFVGVGSDWLAWISEHGQYAYRAPLVHLVLTFPHGRAVGRIERGAVAAVYLAGVVTPVWRDETTSIVLAGCLVAVAGRSVVRRSRRERRARASAAFTASTFVAILFAAGAAVRLAYHTQSAQAATLLADQAALIALPLALLAVLLSTHADVAEVTDLVVDLGQNPSGTLRRALATTLHDPTLTIGYWSAETGTYVDDTGARLDLPDERDERVVTPVGSDGRPVAVVVHDPVLLEDPALLDAVAAASRLTASNAQLHAEVRAQLDELESSRQRLLRSEDEQRRRLEQRLREGAERRLLELERVLRDAQARSSSDRASSRIRDSEEQAIQTLAQLRELALGLHPRVLGERGLAGALASLAEQCPVPVELALSQEPLPEEIERAVYFVCSEALANVAKYAAASAVSVVLGCEPGVVRVEVTDDGVGGTDPSSGSGLRGLADRVEALGGTFRVEGAPGEGTRVDAVFALGSA